MKIPHILVNSANVLHILPILVNSAMLVNSASINMQYYEYFAYTNGDVTGVQGPYMHLYSHNLGNRVRHLVQHGSS